MSSNISETDKKIFWKDLSRLSDVELASHIQEIKKYRLEHTNVPVSMSEVTELLKLAIVEQQSRSISKVSKTANRIAYLLLIIAILQFLTSLIVAYKTLNS